MYSVLLHLSSPPSPISIFSLIFLYSPIDNFCRNVSGRRDIIPINLTANIIKHLAYIDLPGTPRTEHPHPRPPGPCPHGPYDNVYARMRTKGAGLESLELAS